MYEVAHETVLGSNKPRLLFILCCYDYVAEVCIVTHMKPNACHENFLTAVLIHADTKLQINYRMAPNVYETMFS